MKRFTLLLLAALLAGCRQRGGAFAPFADKPDVVLVTIDTLRADALGYAGNTRVSTPQLDRIAAEGVEFTDAHAQNVMTLPSHVNILTGLYPFQHGVRDNDGFVLDPKIPTLATYLKRDGYATGAFVAAFPLDSRFGLAHDFDVYDQSYPEGVGPYNFVMAERPAPEVVAAALKWYDAVPGRPRFLWVHVYDCHAPYRPRPPFDAEYRDNPYLGEVASVDDALAPLFDRLRAEKGKVILVVTGDHGEALGEHGERTHGLFAYEATLHVPLLVWAPGHLSHRVDRSLARHVDIVPTILTAVGLKPPANLPGISLLAPHDDAHETSYFEALSAMYNRGWAPLRGEMGGGWKYIELPIPELYDLPRDPAEAHNDFEPHAAPLRPLKNALPEGLGRAERRSATTEEAARLRSLGYLTGSAPAKAKYGPEDDPKNLIGLDNELHDVVDLYQQRKLPAAIALARKIVSQRPGMRSGYEFLSFLLGQADDDAGAIQVLAQAEQRGLLDESLRARWGLLCAESGRTAEALRVLAPLAASRNPDSLNALGIAQASSGDVAAALATFQRAAAADPRDGQAWQNIGITQLQAGRVPEALDALGRALAINTKLPRAWNARGVAYEKSGRPADAIACWKKAVEYDPDQFDALFNIALVAHAGGDDDTARAALSDFVARAPAARYGADIAQARQMLARLGQGGGKP